jgi:hypothetical protein
VQPPQLASPTEHSARAQRFLLLSQTSGADSRATGRVSATQGRFLLLSPDDRRPIYCATNVPVSGYKCRAINRERCRARRFLLLSAGGEGLRPVVGRVLWPARQLSGPRRRDRRGQQRQSRFGPRSQRQRVLLLGPVEHEDGDAIVAGADKRQRRINRRRINRGVRPQGAAYHATMARMSHSRD